MISLFQESHHPLKKLAYMQRRPKVLSFKMNEENIRIYKEEKTTKSHHHKILCKFGHVLIICEYFRKEKILFYKYINYIVNEFIV